MLINVSETFSSTQFFGFVWSLVHPKLVSDRIVLCTVCSVGCISPLTTCVFFSFFRMVVVSVLFSNQPYINFSPLLPIFCLELYYLPIRCPLLPSKFVSLNWIRFYSLGITRCTVAGENYKARVHRHTQFMTYGHQMICIFRHEIINIFT